VNISGQTWLVWGAQLWAWSPGGYRHSRARSSAPRELTVQTPKATVATLAASYRPIVHPTCQDTDQASQRGR
jgi:hypothetical protein